MYVRTYACMYAPVKVCMYIVIFHLDSCKHVYIHFDMFVMLKQYLKFRKMIYHLKQ